MYQLLVYPITPAGRPRRAPARSGATMYQLLVYPITPDLRRWEIRCGGALLRCGTAPTKGNAQRDVNEVVNT